MLSDDEHDASGEVRKQVLEEVFKLATPTIKLQVTFESSETASFEQAVYNLCVANDHTYFVGEAD